MLTVRYSALFEPSLHEQKYLEMTLSLLTLEHFVAPYVKLEVILYVNSEFSSAFRELMLNFSFTYRLYCPLASAQYENDRQFVSTIERAEDVDKICIIRMLNDFRELSCSNYRLLIGTDVFFFGIPDELLSFCWSEDPDKRVLYMADVTTFRGGLYQLRYFKKNILEGLLGDFYCLAPGVSLREDSITGCLKMIDGWPVQPSRYIPAIAGRSTQCKQQAASILLHQFGGELLPPVRYSHNQIGPEVIVCHTHDLGQAIRHVPQTVLMRFLSITGLKTRIEAFSQ